MHENLDRKNLLFLSPFFYPEAISTGKYNSRLVDALLASGHTISVVCSYPLYPDWLPKSTNKSLPKISIYRGGLNVRYPKSVILRRMVLEFWFAFHCVKSILKNRLNPDVVLAVLPPVSFLLLIPILFSKRVKVIGIVHDLQGIMAVSSPGIIRMVIAWILRKIETLALGRCDRIICLSESMKCAIQDVYGVRGVKCDVQYPFVTYDFSGNENESEYLVDKFPPGYKHIVYAGALGEKQRPAELVNFFMALCRKRKDVMCHIFSAGPIYESIKVAQKDLDETRVQLHALVPEQFLGELFKRSDIQVIPQAPGTSMGAFPSKLPNIIAAGVPIFAICDERSELSEVIRNTGTGIVAHSWNIEYLIGEINQLIDSNEDLTRDQIQRRAGYHIEKYFNIKQIINIIDNYC